MPYHIKHELDAPLTEQLKELMRINLVSAGGFMIAADNVGDPTLTDLFMTAAGERRLSADQLARALALPVVRPPVREAASGGVHRWWIDLRARFSDDRHGLLAEAERGEEQVMQLYENVLRCTAGSTVNDLVRRQYDKVKSIHEQIVVLRDRAEDINKPV